jgi:hypothetical protein
MHIFARKINPNVKTIKAAMASGLNPADVPLLALGGKGGYRTFLTLYPCNVSGFWRHYLYIDYG